MVQTTVNIYEAKTHLSRMVDRAAEGEEIIIFRNGRPVARLCQLEPRKRNSVKFGLLKGRFEVPDDFDAPLPDDLLRLFEGGE
jgi:prevent-host-death family protein